MAVKGLTSFYRDIWTASKTIVVLSMLLTGISEYTYIQKVKPAEPATARVWSEYQFASCCWPDAFRIPSAFPAGGVKPGRITDWVQVNMPSAAREWDDQRKAVFLYIPSSSFIFSFVMVGFFVAGRKDRPDGMMKEKN